MTDISIGTPFGVKKVVKSYVPSKTLMDFHLADDFFRGVMGPIGSGKSVGCTMEIYSRAVEQPMDDQGRRRSRWLVTRNTFPELKSTTIKTFQEWVPPEVCPIKYGSPIEGRLSQLMPDGTEVDAEFLFMALDQPKDISKLLSLELTGAWINEAREVPKDVVDAITSRVGRYPPKSACGRYWTGIIADTNPPDTDHWWYRLAEEETPMNYRFWRQPSALVKEIRSDETVEYLPNPEAENAEHQPLGYDYWLRMLGGKTPEWIKVYVMGEYGTVIDGKPIYPEYNDQLHCGGRELDPYKNLPLVLGWDFGLTPACAICQVSPRGKLRVLNELVAENMGIRQFARDVVRPFLKMVYPGIKEISIADPAGTARAQTDERTCMTELMEADFDVRPADTNSFLARREAVAGFLTKMVDGNPAFELSSTCHTLRRGFQGGYQFERMQVSGERYRDVANKNKYSHVHDGLQYAALFAAAQVGMRTRVRMRPVRRTRSAGGWT